MSAPAQKKIAVLSGAPRVSTHPNFGEAGPRTHLLGMMEGFSDCGLALEKFICGDHVPFCIRSYGSNWGCRKPLWLERALGDALRITLAKVNAGLAFKTMSKDLAFVYERASSFQALGTRFKRKGIPWIIHSDGLFYQEAFIDRKSIALPNIAKRIELDAYTRCDCVVTVSTAMQESLIEAGVSENKILVLPNAVSSRSVGHMEPDLKSRWFDYPTIGYVGTVSKWQNLEMLIDCLSKLKHEFKVGLAIAGSGPELSRLKLKTEELGLNEQVVFLGQIGANQVQTFLRGIDIGFSGQIPMSNGKMYHSPLKLYEYMAAGKVPLASAYDDASSLIEDGENGFLFDSSNTVELKAALLRCLSVRDNLQEIGKRCVNKICNGHTWKHRTTELLSYMQKRGI